MAIRKDIRNLAIIAHVDHGKTTLVDGMLKQSGLFRANEAVVERVMDSLDLERERGITIMAKNASVRYKGVKINIVDTPGHSDFGGEVERVLKMVDGVMLLVDASEGPLPQTRYVLSKALAQTPGHSRHKQNRPPGRPGRRGGKRSVRSIHRPRRNRRPDRLPCDLHQCPSRHRSALDGRGHHDLRPLFDRILQTIPPPAVTDGGALQILVTNLDYNEYVGRLAIGRIFAGTVAVGDQVSICKLDGSIEKTKVSKLYASKGSTGPPWSALKPAR